MHRFPFVPALALTIITLASVCHAAPDAAEASTLEATTKAFIAYLLDEHTNITKDPNARKRWLTTRLDSLVTAVAERAQKTMALDKSYNAPLPHNGWFFDSSETPRACW